VNVNGDARRRVVSKRSHASRMPYLIGHSDRVVVVKLRSWGLVRAATCND